MAHLTPSRRFGYACRSEPHSASRAASIINVICFGELMLRLSAPGCERLLQTPSFDAEFCGAEANVAVGLAHFGVKVDMVTALPENTIGDAAVNALRGFGVGTEHIIRCGNRLGICFVEAGAGYRPARVLYDRAGSSLAEVPAGAFNWPRALEGADWLHITGITPAVSRKAADATLKAVQAARELGVKVSCDANYRSTLWRYCESPIPIMTEIFKGVTLLSAGADDFEQMLGLAGQADDYVSLFEALSAEAMDTFPNLQYVAGTVRDVRSASSNGWSGVLRSRAGVLRAKRYEIDHIVERIGTGDAFTAGLLYGLVNGKANQEALELAVAAGCLKHSIPGDLARMTLDEVEGLVSASSVRVRR
ncbi:MAG: sugar kinase [Gammaproteobacteria bacterium]|nr:sugar kinase [Gammaproteobacteria bacterium]